MKRNVNKLKLFAATSMAIFTLFASFAGVYAWFLSKLDQASTSDNFEVKDVSGVFKKLYIHEYDEANSTSSLYKFNKIPIGTITKNSETHKVGPYSGDRAARFEMYTLMDRSHPLLFVYEFEKEVTVSADSNLKITAETTSTFMADGEKDQQGVYVEKIHATGNPLSSIVKFKSFGYQANADTTITDSTAITNYNSETEKFEFSSSSLSSMTPFVSFTTVGEDIEYDKFNKTPTFYEGSNGDKVKYVAIIFDYYEDALQYIYNFYLGNDVLNNEVITFKCDWVTLI